MKYNIYHSAYFAANLKEYSDNEKIRVFVCPTSSVLSSILLLVFTSLLCSPLRHVVDEILSYSASKMAGKSGFNRFFLRNVGNFVVKHFLHTVICLHLKCTDLEPGQCYSQRMCKTRLLNERQRIF